MPFVFLGGTAWADTPLESSNKDVALAYYEQVFNAKNFTAAATFIGPNLIQHTALIGDGAAGLEAYIDSLKKEHAGARRDVKRVLTDGDTVIIHGHFIPEPGARGAVVADILRLENGKIVEQWGVVHPITDAPNPNNKNDVF